MKNITLILMLTFVSMAQCQTANIISENEFNNIEINSNDLASINNTFGSQSEIENLFGPSTNSIIDPDGEFMYYEYNGLEIGFSSNVSGSNGLTVLSAIHITNNNYNITIQGTAITVGDNINLLGFVDINTNTDGSKSILYMYCNGCNNYISIDFNQDTNKITSIHYIEQT